ncbi:FAD-dependent oxidoreductase [Pelagibius sp. Alg239-R121]|uniref:GcvT family protein n=1 Tax=Pelagibius sp. Alg239-R121 TaxID=2993448 RepID=UPI0024A62084|nr:FAD-dependent oxidoreductase [Pelagibius sp. Alg239-R121]
MASVPESAEIVIIGGGVIGLSVACHLGWRGAQDVILLERHQLTSGTSWHAAGIIGPLRANMNLTRLSVYAIDLFARLERETGQSTGYKRTGGLWLAQTTDRMTELKRTADMGLLAGLETRILDRAAVQERLPLLETGDLAGGLWVEEDGQANPVDVCMAYARAARQAGVRIFENTPVETVNTRGDAVHSVALADGRNIRCKTVINCAGAWAHELGASTGVAIPLQAVEHMYVVTEPISDLPRPCPIVRDLDARIYIKEDAGRLVLGGFELNAKLFDVEAESGNVPFLELPQDWDQFEPFMLAGLNRIPALNDSGIQHFMNGPESFTPDTKQIMGEAPECRNYFVAAGFNSIGIVSSAGAGKVMADWVLDGSPPMDLADVDITRFESDMSDSKFLTSRTQEAVASQFEMHWPYKRMKTGRGLRRLPCDEVWRHAGATFGSPAGWERPLWFTAGSRVNEERYSYGDQTWWPAAQQECLAARDAAVLIDLSPFSKFSISGSAALANIQQVCSADMDVAAGHSVYTQLLNQRGGIEADATVTRLAEDRFLLVGAAPSRRRDLAWLERHLTPVIVHDKTRSHAVLGLMGPKAPEIWSAAGGDPGALALAFGASAQYMLGNTRLRATRLSFIGEFGWELYLPWNEAAAFAEHLLHIGQPLGLRPMGLHAVDSCRMEKGFPHWGHDIGPEDTPLEAGLGFSVSWKKPDNFIGRSVLERQRETGIERQLLQFAVEDGHPLLLHDEPLFRDGKLAGHTTSGARGFRTGLSLCMGYLALEKGETLDALSASSFEVSIAGKRHPLRLLARSPYDPNGSRMRGTTKENGS